MQSGRLSRGALLSGHLLCALLVARAEASAASPECGGGGGSSNSSGGNNAAKKSESETGTDSGGDNCSYYGGQHRHHCGCCDTPTFSSSDCCECQESEQPQPPEPTTNWTSVFNTWPRKANALKLRHGGKMQAVFPSDIAERWPNLVVLDVTGFRFTGGLPSGLGNLTALRILKLADNQLTGSLPPELGHLRALGVLTLAGNQLTGSLPPELGQLKALYSLDLRGNKLSGSLPPELGKLTSLAFLRLQDNQFRGSLPPELGNSSRLMYIDLSHNQLSGPLPPELGKLNRLMFLHLSHNRLSQGLPPELGFLDSLRWLRLDGNQFSGGLPSKFAGLQRLTAFVASQNPDFCGDAAVLEELMALETLELVGCCFREQHLPALPPNLQVLDLSGNRLSRIPTGWHPRNASLGLRTLLINNNSLSTWVPECRYLERSGVWAWRQLERLELSWNPLGLAAEEFLGSIVFLDRLRVLRVRDANLAGPVVPNKKASECATAEIGVFKALALLDLSGNNITAFLWDPPAHIVTADLSRNALTRLNDGWWQVLQGMDVRGNPGLQMPVLLDPSAPCPELGARQVHANPRGWSRTTDGWAECTSVCEMEQTLFQTDASLNVSVLCRCAHGRGVGLDCGRCPDNSFSIQSFENGHYARTCARCPADSTLTGGSGTCFTDCSCAAGHHMVQLYNGSVLDVGATPCSLLAPEGRCLSCGLFKTSLPGSRKAAECFCNSNETDGRGWRGLLERQGRCGCPEGSHMNFATRSCTPCQTEEDCRDWIQSLAPPRVKPGYWALPPPPEGSDGMFGNFSRHSIWRCQSTKTCLGGAACGQNRTGTACSLCKPGHFLMPTGSCAPCTQSYTEARRLLAGILLGCMLVPVVVHFQLRSAGGEARGLALSLRSVRVSLKQLLKFLQILGLVSLFRVEWPPAAEDIFAVTRAFSLGFATWTGVACLDARQEQTMTLELTFRWVLPLVGVVITCLSALLINVCGLVLGSVCRWCRPQSETRLRGVLSFQVMDVLRVLVFFLNLLFPSLLKNALLPLTCAPSPNGLLTMSAFPHSACWTGGLGGEESFWTVAAAGFAQAAMLSIGFPLLLFFAWRRIAATDTPEATQLRSWLERRRRWWAFLFADFRQRKMHWALVSLCKDIVLNLIVVFLPGFGTAQLLLTSVVCVAYACQAYCSSPYPDLSNSCLETCTAAGIAALCIFSAGVGFQSEPDVLDVGAFVAAGRDGPGYFWRTIGLLSIQALALAGPLAILVLQLLAAFPFSQRFLPSRLRPWTAEQRAEWSHRFTRAMRTSAGPLPNVLAEFDGVDFDIFRRAVTSAALARRSLSLPKSSGDTGKKVEEGEESQQRASITDISAADTQSPVPRPGPPSLSTDTEVRALREEIAALKAGLQQREEAFQQREEAFHHREQALQKENKQLRRQVKRTPAVSL